jgi:hypothetical protein
MRRLSILAMTVAASSLLALVAAGPAAAAPREFFGLVPQGEAPPSSDIERMGQGNVGSVRLLFNWPSIEPSDDQFNWTAIDSYIGGLAAAGIRPFPFLWGTPGFVSPDNLELPVGSAADQAQWREFVREAVNRYRPGGEYWTNPALFAAQHPGANRMPVETWQVWNEQNAPKHVDKPDPSGYAKLLDISHSAITGEDPNAEVVLGGMFGKPTGKGGLKAWSFLKRLYKSAGVKGDFDGVSLHPYSPTIGGIKSQVNKIRKVLKKKKDKGADLWVTEIGWGSTKKGRLGVGKKKQSKLLQQSFKLLNRKRGKWNVGGAFWYTWRDIANAPCEWCGSAGLFRQNGFDPKPAWKKFVRFTGGS